MATCHAQAAIVIPVHDEEACLAACLSAACSAANETLKLATSTVVIVVLDRCSDESNSIASQFPVEVLRADAGSVGAARSRGAAYAMELGATWLAFTDADTLVSPDWLSAQLSLDADVVCGTVAISDWHLHDPLVRVAYETLYTDADGHRHIHGANLGLTSAAYLACGGFEDVASNEDVDLVNRLVQLQVRVEWSALPRVSTSARVVNRVDGGFGGFIRKVAKSACAENAPEGKLTA